MRLQIPSSSCLGTCISCSPCCGWDWDPPPPAWGALRPLPWFPAPLLTELLQDQRPLFWAHVAKPTESGSRGPLHAPFTAALPTTAGEEIHPRACGQGRVGTMESTQPGKTKCCHLQSHVEATGLREGQQEETRSPGSPLPRRAHGTLPLSSRGAWPLLHHTWGPSSTAHSVSPGPLHSLFSTDGSWFCEQCPLPSLL